MAFKLKNFTSSRFERWSPSFAEFSQFDTLPVMFISYLIFFSAVTAHHSITMPSASCLFSARTIASDLQTSADKLAGRPLAIEIKGGPVLSSAFVLPAKVEGGVIFVNRQFCDLPAPVQLAGMAHEIGHLVDFADHPEPTQDSAGYANGWTSRPWEVAANRYAKNMLQLRGVTDPEVLKFFPD